jgi:alkanesulfonate monooxygenase SsuD/methylene tetrahydromethanopterin reductase-like flavin-dependent oxidoreductase (luciferase family)
MRLGLNIGYSGSTIGSVLPLVEHADRVGIDSVWAAEAYGSDAVTVLPTSPRGPSGSSSAARSADAGRTPANTAMTAMTLDALSGGRFLLGLGLSGPQVVEGWHGVPYGKPLGKHPRVRGDRAQGDRSARSRSSTTASTTRSPTGPGRDRARQAAEVDPAPGPRPHPDLPRRDRAEERRADRGDRRRLAADLLLPEREDHLQRAPRRRPAPRPAATRRARHRRDRVRGRRRRHRRLPGHAAAVLRALHRRHGRAGPQLLPDLATRYGFEEAADARSRTSTSTGKKDEAAGAVPDALVDEMALVGPDRPHRRPARGVEGLRVGTLILGTQQPEVLTALQEAL